MTIEDHRQVRGRVPCDGLLWHTVVSIEDGTVETGCGRLYSLDDADVEISEIGERLRDLSGSSICYQCTTSRAPRPETGETREGSA